MDIECEIQNSGTCRQNPEFPGRGEYENFLRRRLREVITLALGRMLESISHRCQPLVHCLLVLDSLVGPVGSVSVLSHIVHPPGTDLDLNVGVVLVPDGDVK